MLRTTDVVVTNVQTMHVRITTPDLFSLFFISLDSFAGQAFLRFLFNTDLLWLHSFKFGLCLSTLFMIHVICLHRLINTETLQNEYSSHTATCRKTRAQLQCKGYLHDTKRPLRTTGSSYPQMIPVRLPKPLIRGWISYETSRAHNNYVMLHKLQNNQLLSE